MLQIWNGPTPIIISQRAAGHFKSVTHTKVMLLLLSLDIVNFKIKLVDIVGFWSSSFQKASTFQGDSSTVYRLFLTPLLTKISRLSRSQKKAQVNMVLHMRAFFIISLQIDMCLSNTAF